MVRRTILLAAAGGFLALFAGCASVPADHEAVDASALVAKARKSLDAGHMKAAAKTYLKAAMHSKNPGVAAQATALAWHVGKAESLEKAARRWQALAPEKPEPHHFLAIVALRRHDLDSAVKQLSALLETESGKNDFGAVSETLIKGGSAYEAYVVMRRLETGYTDNPKAEYTLALFAARAEHSRVARRKLQRALDLKPDWLKASLLRARLLIRAGEVDKALAPVREVMQAAPGIAIVKLRYAQLLLAAGRSEKGRTLLHEVLKSGQQRADALLMLALDRLHHGDVKRGRRYLTLLLESGEKRDQAYFYLGRLSARDGNNRMALDWLRRMNHDNGQASDEIAIATTLAKMDNLDAARKFLKRARKRTPGLSDAFLIGEANLLVKQDQTDAAFDLLDDVLKTQPKNTQLLYARGMLAAQIGQPDHAIKYIDRVVRLEPENTAALNALGYMLTEHTRRYERARDYIEKALSYSPHNAAIIDSLGWVEYRQGDTSHALKALERAHRLNDDPVISAHLVSVLRASGEHDRAREVLERALAAHPDAKPLKQLKGES